jgi:hypothetical protein
MGFVLGQFLKPGLVPAFEKGAEEEIGMALAQLQIDERALLQLQRFQIELPHQRFGKVGTEKLATSRKIAEN